jgi:hypothetical protein
VADSTTAHVLTAADILESDDCPRVRVEIPEWGGHVYLRTLDAAELWTLQDQIKANKDNLSLMCLIVAMAACDEKGERLFTAQDAEKLKAKNAQALIRVCDAAQRLNGLTDDDLSSIEGN